MTLRHPSLAMLARFDRVWCGERIGGLQVWMREFAGRNDLAVGKPAHLNRQLQFLGGAAVQGKDRRPPRFLVVQDARQQEIQLRVRAGGVAVRLDFRPKYLAAAELRGLRKWMKDGLTPGGAVRFSHDRADDVHELGKARGFDPVG